MGVDTQEGEKDLCRLVRRRDRGGNDVQQVRVIKDRYLLTSKSLLRKWKEQFEELMNERMGKDGELGSAED